MKDKKILLLVSMIIVLSISIAIYFIEPETEARTEMAFPLEVKNIEHGFPWLNVTLSAIEDVTEPIVGFELRYEDRVVDKYDRSDAPIEMFQYDTFTVNIPLASEIPSGTTIEIRLLLGDKYYQKFEVEIES